MQPNDLTVMLEPNTLTLFITNNTMDRWWCHGHTKLVGKKKSELILPLVQDYIQPKDSLTVAMPETVDYTSFIGIYPFRIGKLYKGIGSENLFHPDVRIIVVSKVVTITFK